MFDEFHNWLFFKFGFNVSKKILMMIFMLMLSFVALFSALIINGIGTRSSVPIEMDPATAGKRLK